MLAVGGGYDAEAEYGSGIDIAGPYIHQHLKSILIDLITYYNTSSNVACFRTFYAYTRITA